VTNEEMIFYEFNDKEKLIQKARFRIKPGYRRLVFKENILLFLSEVEKQTNKLHLVDLDKFEEVDSLEQEKISLCENLDLQAFAVTDGKEYLRVEGTEQDQNEEILDISLQEPTSLCVHTCEKDKKYLLACGQSNGNISVWKVESLNGKWEHKLLVKNQLHDSMVSTLSFLDDARIVSGGIDRKISILKFGEDADDLKGHQENILHMTIKCKGMKIEDLKGSKEQEMFKKLIQNE
jgi:WD40 repeat protein